MMQEEKSRVLVVSGRSLVAQGLKSLLASQPEISEVVVIDNLYDALMYSAGNPPDTMVIDMPMGADLFVDRPISIDGLEIKTIVLLEEGKNGRARLYVHTPGKIANLENLMAAIMLDRGRKPEEESANQDIEALMDASSPAPEADAPQPNNLIKARASGPSKSRISTSKAES